MNSTVGTILQKGKYKIDGVLGQGGFGITYLGIHAALGQAVVFKTLNQSLHQHPEFDRFQRQFLLEAQRLSQCHHPHIVRILDFFSENGLLWVVMDYIPGPTLAELISSGKPLSVDLALHYIRQVASALEAVHRSGLLHRDLKPENLIRRSGTNVIMVTDFGIARDFTPGMRQTHTSLLSAGYAPPEQYLPHEPLTPAADIYALAATFYCLLTGQPPAAAPLRMNPTTALRVPLLDLRQLHPEIPHYIENAIIQGLELDKNRRPQTLTQWLQMLMSQEELEKKKVQEIQNLPLPVLPVELTASREMPRSPQSLSSYYPKSYKGLLSLIFAITAVVSGCAGFNLANRYGGIHLFAKRQADQESLFPNLSTGEFRNQDPSKPLFSEPSVESNPIPSEASSQASPPSDVPGTVSDSHSSPDHAAIEVPPTDQGAAASPSDLSQPSASGLSDSSHSNLSTPLPEFPDYTSPAALPPLNDSYLGEPAPELPPPYVPEPLPESSASDQPELVPQLNPSDAPQPSAVQSQDSLPDSIIPVPSDSPGEPAIPTGSVTNLVPPISVPGSTGISGDGIPQ